MALGAPGWSRHRHQLRASGPLQRPSSEPVPGSGPTGSCSSPACSLHTLQLFSLPLKHMYKGKPQYNANSGAQYPIQRTAIHQTVRDKKHNRFGINIEKKMNINLQSSTKTMGSKEIDITNSPYSIRLGSHLPQTPIANLDLKDKSSRRRALPLSCLSDASA